MSDEEMTEIENGKEADSNGSPRYKRTYVACDSCRARKVRCVMGEKPPCAKCKREHRDCRFDRRPRTAKHRDLPTWSNSGPETRSTSAAALQSRIHGTQARPSATPPQLDTQLQQEDAPIEARTPSTSSERYRTTWAKTSLQNNCSISARVISNLVTGSNDALEVLSDAANLLQSPSTGPPSTRPNNSTQDIPVAIPSDGQSGCQSGIGFIIVSLSEPSETSLDMWDKCRFVRQGWFTSQEAVTYVDLFFKYLSPLSPVVVDQYRSHEAHSGLICHESMLCCTILMISSRFFMLPGAGGASRSHLIHNRLWQYCESLIKRIILGQEKVSTSKMRITGTIESLLLISDWHPRAVHFPPDTEGWDAVLIDTEYDRQNRKRTNNEEPLLRWRKDVFEPAKRASRMSWMLLGLATNLAYELGIMSTDYLGSRNSLDDTKHRNFRAQKLLYTYMTQTATRLGYHSVLPESVSIAASLSTMEDTDDTSRRSWSAYMDAHLELTRLYKVASSMFFQSGGQLQAVLQNDNYSELLEHFQSSLSTWTKTFDVSLKSVPEQLRDSLLIELHHLRACIGAISIQAVVQRAAVSESTRSQKDGLAAYMTPQDARFLQQVIADSSLVLRIATVTPFKLHLAYAPARIRLNVISASVFLLKAVSLGSPATDMDAALHILDECTKTLKSCPPDDMDFAMRYADLIEKHASSLRENLVSVPQWPEGSVSLCQRASSDVTANLDGVDLGDSGFRSDGDARDDSAFDQHGFWRAWQFDSSIAPFGESVDQLSQGFDIDSLNFLWNLPDISS